ncbi:hypothetical protein V6N11_065206 [Hibiscus sabdariffa]|uniref:Uncharacterized protein n=1 Tax=Hibiscus sabdariffa TaxID=183260 RepID=A0ABR2QGU0_9ROSI
MITHYSIAKVSNDPIQPEEVLVENDEPTEVATTIPHARASADKAPTDVRGITNVAVSPSNTAKTSEMSRCKEISPPPPFP